MYEYAPMQLCDTTKFSKIGSKISKKRREVIEYCFDMDITASDMSECRNHEVVRSVSDGRLFMDRRFLRRGGHLKLCCLHKPCDFLLFQNPRLLDDVSFHPCVRFKRWESERILSFIPPDGNFRLLSYHVSAQK